MSPELQGLIRIRMDLEILDSKIRNAVWKITAEDDQRRSTLITQLNRVQQELRTAITMLHVPANLVSTGLAGLLGRL